MSGEFDQKFWEAHWRDGEAADGSMSQSTPNPYLSRELHGVEPGTALDAGCGAGAEAIWLASHGWQVTAVDISATALARATDRATDEGVEGTVRWVEADLTTWEPGSQFDLVTTHYAHPAIPQLDFYRRIAGWVAPGGTLLVVGHLHTHHGAADEASDHQHADEAGDHPHAGASTSAPAITALLDPAVWDVVTADQTERPVGGGGEGRRTLRDVVLRAIRRG